MDDISLNEARRVIRRGNFRLKAGENESAYSLFEKALEKFPESVEIMNILGTLAIKMGNIDEGIRYYRDSLVIKDKLSTKIELGFTLILNNQIEEAHEIFTELDISDPDVKAGLGISMVLLNQDLRKAADLLVIADEYELGINISTFLGSALSQIGQLNKALSEFRKNKTAWQNMHAIGVQYWAMDTYSRAQNHFKGALEKYKQDVGEDNIDQTIINKINFDIILTEQYHETRRLLLLSLIEGGYQSLDVYLALISTQYELSFYESPLADYIKKAKQYLEADQIELKDQLDAWLEKTEGKL